MADARQYCTFFVDGHFFGLDLLKVQEIIRYQELTRVPLAAAGGPGVDQPARPDRDGHRLRRRLELNDRPDDQLPVNVVVHTEDGAVSLLVDEIGDVLEVPDEIRTPARDAPGAGPGADPRRLQARGPAAPHPRHRARGEPRGRACTIDVRRSEPPPSHSPDLEDDIMATATNNNSDHSPADARASGRKRRGGPVEDPREGRHPDAAHATRKSRTSPARSPRSGSRKRSSSSSSTGRSSRPTTTSSGVDGLLARRGPGPASFDVRRRGAPPELRVQGVLDPVGPRGIPGRRVQADRQGRA